MIDFERAKLDPTDVFNHPSEVTNAGELSREQKLEILERWKYDALELEIADEENMCCDEDDLMADILKAIHDIEES